MNLIFESRMSVLGKFYVGSTGVKGSSLLFTSSNNSEDKDTFFVFLYYNSDLGCKWNLIKTCISLPVWHELDFRVQDERVSYTL